jgi:hypothetical protein
VAFPLWSAVAGEQWCEWLKDIPFVLLSALLLLTVWRTNLALRILLSDLKASRKRKAIWKQT